MGRTERMIMKRKTYVTTTMSHATIANSLSGQWLLHVKSLLLFSDTLHYYCCGNSPMFLANFFFTISCNKIKQSSHKLLCLHAIRDGGLHTLVSDTNCSEKTHTTKYVVYWNEYGRWAHTNPEQSM